MADRVTAKAEADKSFTPHPEGGCILQCVDVVNYGKVVGEWQGKVKIQDKVGLFFQSGKRNEQGELFTVQMEFTLSMFEGANLRKFLEMWRGRPYTEQQALDGVPIDKLEGHYGYGVIAHKESRKGRLFAMLNSIMPVPDGMPLPTLPAYKRPEYVEKKKAEYAAAWAAHQTIEAAAATPKGSSARMEGPGRDTSFEDFPDVLEADDDLPF